MSENSELSGLALREAVAVKVMKLTNVREIGIVHRQLFYTESSPVHPVPAYESDPSACAAMEARIKELGIEREYAVELRLECAPRMVMAYEPLDILMACIFATPEQRCRAALAAVEGK